MLDVFFCKGIVLSYLFFLHSGYHIVIGCNNSNLDVLPTIFLHPDWWKPVGVFFNFCLKLYASGCNYIFDQFAWDAVLYLLHLICVWTSLNFFLYLSKFLELDVFSLLFLHLEWWLRWIYFLILHLESWNKVAPDLYVTIVRSSDLDVISFSLLH
jgi:hypothetical protein